MVGEEVEEEEEVEEGDERAASSYEGGEGDAEEEVDVVLGVGEVIEVVVVGGEEGLFVPVYTARRDLSSLFSFLVSFKLFSRESMCILNSTLSEDNFAIFWIKS
jgi:hypothetical protein